MSKSVRAIAIVLMVAGVVMIVAGGVTYFVVQQELSDEQITVSDDADYFAGEPVEGPFTAYSEAQTIKKHAADIADGQTYAQLAQDDPRRESVMTSSFLRASLFTSVVAFGVAVLVIGLGVLFIVVGIALRVLDRRTGQVAATATAPAPAPAPAPSPSPASAPLPAE
jgi:LPS O-antigen subunit length determinant protein (WzzB/FepE family)